jgi:hypothetical protein
MADNKDGPKDGLKAGPGAAKPGAPGAGGTADKAAGQGGSLAGAAGVSKKPSALIDLKATEVEVREVGRAASGAAPDGPKPAVASLAENAKPLTPPPANPASVTPVPAAKPVETGKPAGTSPGTWTAGSTSSAQSPQRPPAPALGPSAVSPPPTPRASGGGLRTAATHLGAGLAGGLLALLGADALRPVLGLQATVTASLPADLSKRLEQLEAGVKQAAVPNADVTRKLAAAETRLGKVDEMEKTVSAFHEIQASFGGQLKTLGEKLEQPAPLTAADSRLAKLEQTFQTLTEAAATDPQAGRIAQLAGVSSKLTDLEMGMAVQIAALRRSVTQEVDSRLNRSTEASEAARSSTQRLDRDVAAVKTEAAQFAQRLEGVKNTTDRADIAVRGLKDEATELKTALETVKSEFARELKQVARPNDVKTALSPVASKLVELEQNVQGVVKSEEDRRANAERIVLALELGNLKRAIERGTPFAAELTEVRRAGGPKLDLAKLDRHKDRGVPALTELVRDFRGVAHAMIEADAEAPNAGWTDRLLAGAKSIVRVRRVDQGADDTGIEAVVARIEIDLKDGKLAEVSSAAAKLPAKVLTPARGWLDKVEARASVERAVVDIEGELKAALGSAKKG